MLLVKVIFLVWIPIMKKPSLIFDKRSLIDIVGEYIDKAKAGFDGFVHEYPFTCMPEVTARTIITNKLKKIYDLPVIYFSFDEQSGMEGFRTRLEAFCDLMNSRREQEIRNNPEFMANGHKKIYPHYGDTFYNKCIELIQTQ